MEITLSGGAIFTLEPDITVLLGANSAVNWALLYDISCEVPFCMLDNNCIKMDGGDLRVSQSLIDKNKISAAVFNCPEAYIHPWRYYKLFEILQAASQHKRIILTTFSPLFLNLFEPRMVRVVERGANNRLVVRPIDRTPQFEAAMEAYDRSLGELWYTNLFGGNPL